MSSGYQVVRQGDHITSSPESGSENVYYRPVRGRLLTRGDTSVLMGDRVILQVALCGLSVALLFLDEQLRDNHEVVCKHGGAYQQFESLASFGQAALHSAAREEDGYAPFDTGPERLGAYSEAS